MKNLFSKWFSEWFKLSKLKSEEENEEKRLKADEAKKKQGKRGINYQGDVDKSRCYLIA